MIDNKRIAVVMPAYNVATTLKMTVEEIDRDVVDDIILVDNDSADETVKTAQALGIFVHCQPENRGFGGNLKTGYRIALQRNADIVVTLHPDYQYDPHLVPAMAHLLNTGTYDAVLGSRILGSRVCRKGMPKIRFIANRFLTFYQNFLLREDLSEYHTGYRAYKRDVLEQLPLIENSNDFLFDNQILMQILAFKFRIGEVSCPTKYFAEASSINMWKSFLYSCGLMKDTLRLVAHRLGLKPNNKLFGREGRRLLEVSDSEFPGTVIEPESRSV